MRQHYSRERGPASQDMSATFIVPYHAVAHGAIPVCNCSSYRSHAAHPLNCPIPFICHSRRRVSYTERFGPYRYAGCFMLFDPTGDH